MADDKLIIPEKDSKDRVHVYVKAVIGGTPFAGPTLSELFCGIFKDPMEKKMTVWFQSVAEVLNEIQEKVSSLSPEAFFMDLQKDDNFISVLIKTSRIAAAEHQEEKLEILRNVILNVATGTDISEDCQSIFLSWIEDHTPSHINLLIKQSDPMKVFRDDGLTDKIIKNKLRNVGIGGVWKQVFPEYIDNRDLYDLLLDDLKSRNLITVENTHVQGIDKPVKWGKGLTTIGGQFVDFITRPT